MATVDAHAVPEAAPNLEQDSAKPNLTPPASVEAYKNGDSSSELSELDNEEDDIGDVEPDHYWEGGRIPVFKPV